MTNKQRIFNLDDVINGNLTTIEDNRGFLVIGEIEKNISFSPKRFFIVHPSKKGEKRGGHAHIENWQLLVSISGSCEVMIDDGLNSKEFLLEEPDSSLLIPAGIWSTQTYISRESLLLVLCDSLYDETDYIRNYPEFVKYRKTAIS